MLTRTRQTLECCARRERDEGDKELAMMLDFVIGLFSNREDRAWAFLTMAEVLNRLARLELESITAEAAARAVLCGKVAEDEQG